MVDYKITQDSILKSIPEEPHENEFDFADHKKYFRICLMECDCGHILLLKWEDFFAIDVLAGKALRVKIRCNAWWVIHLITIILWQMGVILCFNPSEMHLL